MATTVYHLRITLMQTDPPVWRDLEVPSDISLALLHHVIQVVMGWEDYHLHQFTIGDVRYEIPMPETDPEPDVLDATGAILGQLVPSVRSSFMYEYDFGDGWEHRINVRNIAAAEEGVEYPRCTGGERACPPEDCGGPFGFEGILHGLANPGDPEVSEIMEWLEDAYEEYDPAAFDPEVVNQALRQLRGRRTRTKK